MKFPDNTDSFAYRAAEIAKHSEHRDFLLMRWREQWRQTEHRGWCSRVTPAEDFEPLHTGPLA